MGGAQRFDVVPTPRAAVPDHRAPHEVAAAAGCEYVEVAIATISNSQVNDVGAAWVARIDFETPQAANAGNDFTKGSIMAEAWIIDACRTPRGIGKAGKGALAGIHPQQLGAAVLRALADRTAIDTADVEDIVWGTSSQRGPQSGDLGRMSALDAGYDVRTSGVTLDRFCGSGITSVNMAAASIMSGSEDLVIAGGTEMMSMEGRRGEGPLMMDAGNLRLRARHRNRIKASAPTPLRRSKVSRGRTSTGSATRASRRPPMPSRPAISTRARFRFTARTAALRSTGRNIRGRRPRSKGSPA
jgi:hypothetical protein